MIQLIDISKVFKQGIQQTIAISNITLHVKMGEIYGIIGSSGAGKSTLIRCVNLLERPTNGIVLVDNQDITKLSPRNLTHIRRQMGMVFQHFNLLSSRTVYGNIALPLELNKFPSNKIKNRVYELLELVNLSDKYNAYPASLSGGQKQRVAIARALTNKPKVLLCDEPTNALDPSTTFSILTLLKNINHKLGLTILLITHEMNVVKRICDQVAIIDKGKLIEAGLVKEVFSAPKTELAKQFIRYTLNLDLHENTDNSYQQAVNNKNYFSLV